MNKTPSMTSGIHRISLGQVCRFELRDQCEDGKKIKIKKETQWLSPPPVFLSLPELGQHCPAGALKQFPGALRRRVLWPAGREINVFLTEGLDEAT